LEKLEQKLKDQQMRKTKPRQIIFEILNRSEKALSAQDIYQKMFNNSQLKADQASVYRNLSLFHKLGLVHKLHSGKYTLCDHEHKENHQHAHIIASCSTCGKAMEIKSHTKDLCKISNEIMNHVDGFSSFSGLTLIGQCSSCT